MPIPHSHRERGQALVIALFITLTLVALTMAMLTRSTTATQEQRSSTEHMRRLHVAEAGVDAALVDLTTGGDGNIGSAVAPMAFDNGTYWVATTANGDGTFTVISRGSLANRTRTLEAVVRESGRIFNHAIFAGNSSDDPNYVMTFGGQGGQADRIEGDIYSGRHIQVSDDAQIVGTARAGGTITGTTGTENVEQPIPDLQGMQYEVNHDVNVKAEFDANQTYSWDEAGGSAWQVPESNAASFLRKNPDDRSSETTTTQKDDYFLEDPYEPVRNDPAQNGSDPYRVTLTGANEQVRKVYYIDGNLWIHNPSSYSFMLDSPHAAGVQVTFVVKGNIYISDNIFYQRPDVDGIAFIAIKDPGASDSGNIYFGDPRYGTLEHMDCFMYAENNFFDNNLSDSGSDHVKVNGVMSAGNHVAINRDFGDQHSRLEVEFDDRLKDGTINLPGLPGAQQELRYSVMTWKELSPYL